MITCGRNRAEGKGTEEEEEKTGALIPVLSCQGSRLNLYIFILLFVAFPSDVSRQ